VHIQRKTCYSQQIRPRCATSIRSRGAERPHFNIVLSHPYTLWFELTLFSLRFNVFIVILVRLTSFHYLTARVAESRKSKSESSPSPACVDSSPNLTVRDSRHPHVYETVCLSMSQLHLLSQYFVVASRLTFSLFLFLNLHLCVQCL